MGEPSRAEAVARFVSEISADALPPAVVARAREALVDTVGVALGGAGVAVSRAVLALLEDEACAGPSTVLTTGRRAPISRAVLANATLASALDLDDGHYGSMNHPGAGVVPAALAVAEARSRSGREVVAALVAGYEIAIHAGIVLNARPGERIYGSGASCTYGAAAAAARLLGLDPGRTGHALGIARSHLPASPAADNIRHGAMAKESLPWGAMTGATAALLAARGFTGAPTALEEPHRSAVAADEAAAWPADGAAGSPDDPLAGLGRRYRITETYVKRFPACLWTHAAVEAALDLRRAHGLVPERIAGITVWTHARAVAIDDASPHSVEAAQYSLPYTVAAALADGELGPAQMREERLGDPRLLDLAARVRLVLDPRLDAMFPARRAARLEIRTRDGREFEREVLTLRGAADDPLTAREVDDKFRRLAGPVLGESRASEALALLRDIDRHDDLAPLWAVLGSAPRGMERRS